MKRVPFTRGLWATVDDADYEAVMAAGPWHVADRLTVVYAVRMLRRPDGRRTTQYLHQFLTGYPRTDHRNCNGLDNRRSNLRPATGSQNLANQRIRKNNRSGFKGVCWHKQTRRWRATIKLVDRQTHLGLFDTPEAAARVYDAAAVAAWGSYARPNFPQAEVAT